MSAEVIDSATIHMLHQISAASRNVCGVYVPLVESQVPGDRGAELWWASAFYLSY